MILYVIIMSDQSLQMAAILVTKNAICVLLAYINPVCVHCVALGISGISRWVDSLVCCYYFRPVMRSI